MGAPITKFEGTLNQSKANKALRLICRDLNLTFVDADSLIQEAIDVRQEGLLPHSLYIDQDHLSKQGSTILALEIVKYLHLPNN